ncbi:hypothetical protein K505DRAFT_322833 [Melanomma pulvis-pyrius CBS 109.77]|uniref:Uncharacterized protein n=1 Tax=Melanomma pulvis-pyrius CBS 109.77 TaxID=1314802 RepID=A0A6A6XKS1_9PLEO|nr:hypothetical protein K505DRAFT_322833 [Melanomma pulvis-pyrius CBS 109.77]
MDPITSHVGGGNQWKSRGRNVEGVHSRTGNLVDIERRDSNPRVQDRNDEVELSLSDATSSPADDSDNGPRNVRGTNGSKRSPEDGNDGPSSKRKRVVRATLRPLKGSYTKTTETKGKK